MSDESPEPDPLLETLLLPSERILWSEGPRQRPIGSTVFDSAIGGGCLLVLFVASGILLAGTAVQELGGQHNPVASFLATLLVLVSGALAWSFVASIRTAVRMQRERAKRRYLVTTKRVLLVGSLENEALLDLAQVAGAKLDKGVIFIVNDEGEIGAAFSELESPRASLVAIEAALARARAEPT